MFSNGNGASPGALVAASLHQPARQRRKSADLSSVERSALMDELVDQLIALKRQVSQDREAFARGLLEHRAILDAHAGVVNRRTIWQRLRWVLVGV